MNEEIHIAVANNKGGAAKTTTIINLAQSMTNEGKRTVVIDGDKNGTCRSWAVRRGETTVPSFPVLSIREAMKYDQAKDIVLYDTEGGISSEEIKDLMSICDFIVIPCKPDMYNMEATDKMAKYFLERDVNFKVLISDAMAGGDYGRARDLMGYFRENKIPYFEQIIARSAKMIDAGDRGLTISNISGARFISDKFDEVARQILKDVATRQVKKKLKKPAS